MSPETPSRPASFEAAGMRFAGLADVASLTELFRTAHPQEPLSPADMRDWLENGGALLLENADGVLLCGLRWRETDEGWHLDRIATLTAARGKGYGRWLMTKVEALAIRQNIAALTLTLDDHQADLLSYYERLGYRAPDETRPLQLSKRVGGMWQYKR